jgi:S1-C subfamily serine protease
MRVELRITSGSRAGQREEFEKSVISIGRNPINDFRFHPELDPDVSSKHAEIRVLDSKVTLFDLGSTNGTFVNGQRIEGSRALFDGDLIGFGGDGPKVEFHTLGEPARTRVSTPDGGLQSVHGAPYAPAAPAAPVRPSAPRRDTNMRIADAVKAQTGTMRKVIITLGVLVIVVAGAAYWNSHRIAGESKEKIDALLRRNDSLNSQVDATIRSLKGKEAGLDAALSVSKNDANKLRSRIRTEQANGNNTQVTKLSAQLDASDSRQRALVGAAQMDFEAINAKNSAAIAFIVIQFPDSSLVSGSGFNVSPSGLIVTNRHVVQDEHGQAATRVAVLFNGTVGFKHAHVVGVSKTDELAFIKLDEAGNYPVVLGVAKSEGLNVGAPVAIIGYPLGTSTAGNGGNISKMRATSTLGVGTVSKILSDTLQFDSWAAQGSSGSAVFDKRGYVIGVLFGGAAESNGRIIYAVPAHKLAAQMPVEGAGIVK